jgi:hypothetical protein
MKSWDLTSGLAVPTYPLDVQKVEEKTSHYAGMSEDKFISAVKSALLADTK